MTQLKIAFDSTAFARPQYGGIARYFAVLARELNKIEGMNATIYSALYRNVYARELPKGSVRGVHLPTVPKTGLIVERTSAFLSERLFTNSLHDIVHETGYRPTASKLKGRIRFVTVFDMISELIDTEMSEATTMAKLNAVRRADHVLCISEKTRNDLVRLFDVDPEKTSISYLGFDPEITNIANKPSIRQRNSRPYILFVGGRRKYKNFIRLLRAYGGDELLRNSLDIVCFGGAPFDKSEQDEIRRLGLSSQQVTRTSGPDSLLGEYYRNAGVYVCPSLYEGFGLPTLEAMAIGCPVAVSNAGSLPEVVGDAGELFEPTDEDSMSSALRKIAFDESHRTRLISEGRRRSRLFTWEACAAATLQAYQDANH